jgi:hypothetical protein
MRFMVIRGSLTISLAAYKHEAAACSARRYVRLTKQRDCLVEHVSQQRRCSERTVHEAFPE